MEFPTSLTRLTWFFFGFFWSWGSVKSFSLMHSGLAKTFSPNTRKNSYFGFLLHTTHSQFRAAYWPDHQLVCLTVLLSLPVFPAKLLLCWHHPPFTTLQMLHLSSFLPQIFFFLISVFRRLPDRFLFACVMEQYFTNCFGSQSTVGIKFYLWTRISIVSHTSTGSKGTLQRLLENSAGLVS